MWRNLETTIRYLRSAANEGTPAGGDGKPAAEGTPAVDGKPAENNTVLGKAKDEGKPGEAKPGEAKPGEEVKPETEEEKAAKAAAAKVDPEKLKLPEGVKLEEVNKDQLTAFTSIIEDPKLSAQDRAQKLIDLHNKLVGEVQDNPYKQWNETQDKWVKELAADKDFGSGDEKAPLKSEVSAQAAKAIDFLGGDALREGLEYTGAGNNPAVVKAFIQMSKILSESGKFRTGEVPGSNTPKSTAARLFPDLPSGDQQQR